MRNSVLEKRIPRPLGIATLCLSLIAIAWLSRNAIIFGTKAAIGNNPKNVKVSNISSDKFTVSYLTDENVLGSASYSIDQNLDQVALDDRDVQSESPTPHKVHHITVTNLTPSTKYFFSIASGDENFQNGETPYEVTTGPPATPSTEESLLTGQVKLEDGSMPSEGIVYVETDDSQLLSSVISPGGSYTLALKPILKKDLLSTLDLSPEDSLKMTVVTSSLLSNVSLLASQTNPVPDIILSKDYDFSLGSSPLSENSSSESAELNSFPEGSEATPFSEPEIITPIEDQKFKDPKPLFRGKALPESDVEILIELDQKINATIKADSDGDWEYRPTIPLDPGVHNITVDALDIGGSIQRLSQQFTVLAQGSQFTEPSISPTSLPSPSPTPTPVPTAIQLSPTPSPVVTQTPTPIIVEPSISATPSATIAPSTIISQPPIPNSGASSFVFGIFGVGVLVAIGSFILFLL